MCGKGHTWDMTPISARQGAWCPRCERDVLLAKERNGKLEKMQKLAQQKGGLCLSTEYVTSKTKLTWQCAQGHVWMAIPNCISMGQWCPKCGKKRTAEKNKLSIDEFRQIAINNGGKLVSEKYITASERLLFECQEGHQWKTTPASIKHAHSWCPVCALENRYKTRRTNIGVFHKIAAGHGGKLLSEKYINNYTPLLWQCSKGHQWYTPPKSIKQGSWCPECKKEKGKSKPKS